MLSELAFCFHSVKVDCGQAMFSVTIQVTAAATFEIFQVTVTPSVYGAAAQSPGKRGHALAVADKQNMPPTFRLEASISVFKAVHGLWP